MYKVAVVGDYDSIYGFAALGLETFPVSDVKETEKVFLELASGSYAVIYITEAAAAGIETAIDRYREQPLPSVILIPGFPGIRERAWSRLSIRWNRQSDRIFCLEMHDRKVGETFQ